MKDVFYKRSRHNKIIALLVVLTMMLTPFVDTAGYGSGAKAVSTPTDADETEKTEAEETEEVSRLMLNQVELRDEKGEAIAYEVDDLYTNQAKTVYIKASSGTEITKMELHYKNGANEATVVAAPEEMLANQTVGEDGKFTVEYEFVIPSDVNVNEWFKKLVVMVGDGRTECISYDAGQLRNVMYDKSEPTLELLSEEISDEWQKSYLYKVRLTSGDQTYEAPLSSASYTIAASTGDKTDEALAVSGLYVENEISVPCSTAVTGTRVSYTVTDMAGNTKTFTQNIKVDNEAPQVGILVNGEAPEYVDGDPVLKISYKDNLTIDAVEVTVTGPAGSSTKQIADATDGPQIDKSEELSLSDIYGKKLVDGSYTIKVNARDKAGNSADEATVTFELDTEKPVVAKPVSNVTRTSIQVSYDNGVTWQNPTSDEIREGIYYTYDGYLYRYAVKATDSGSGIDRVYAVVDGEEKEFTLDQESGLYVCNITTTTDKTTCYEATAVDKVGNIADSVTLQKVQKTSTGLDITAELIYTDNGVSTVVPYNSNVIYTDDAGYSVRVTAESGYKIKKITLNRKDGDNASDDITKEFTEDDNSITSTNRYTVTCEFDIPSEANVNEWFKSMSVTVEDANTSSSSGALGSVMYDCTDPVLELLSDTISDSWVKEYTYKVEIKSGKSAVESALSSVTYSILNSVSNVSEAKLAVNGTSITGSINVPCSDSLDGTKVKYTVSDKAGHTKTFTKNIKVDNVKPTIKLTVNGSKSLSAPINTIPSIKVEYGDNLTVDKVVLKVEGPDGSYEKKAASSIEEVDLSKSKTYKLTDICGSTIADGDYTVSAVITDMAGNSVSAGEVKFTIDRTRPIVSKPSGGTLQCSKDGGKTWSFVKVNSSNTLNGVYYTDPAYLYRYVVSASDTGTGVSKVYAASDGEEKTFKKVTIDKTVYYAINVSPSTDETLTYSVTAVDKAGNKASASANTQKIKQTDKSLSVSVKVFDPLGDVINPKKLSKYITTSGYMVMVTASSGYPIKSVALNRKNGTGDSTNIVYTDFEAPDNVIDSQNRYTVTQTFDMPSDESLNEWFADSYIVVKDTNPKGNTLRYPESGNLLDVMYDITAPTIELDTTDDWVKSYKASYVITSGSMGDDESPLKTVTYKITASNGNVEKEVTIPSGKNTITGKISIPESTKISGSVITIYAEDMAGNVSTYSHKIKVDSTKPDVSVAVDGETDFEKPIKNVPEIEIGYSDNLSVAKATLTVKGPDGTKTKALIESEICSVNIDNQAKYSLTDIYGDNVTDGEYTVEAVIKDKAGNTTKSDKITFVIDRTKPVISSEITSGTKSPKTGDFYNTNVEITFKEKDLSDATITIMDNGTVVTPSWTKTNKTSVGTLTITSEGEHNITYSVVDAAGNKSTAPALAFTIDKTLPVVTASVNGTAYTDATGTLDIKGNASVTISVSDTNKDADDINYRVTTTRPDQSPVTTQYTKTSELKYSFTEEGDYVLEIYAMDKANNKSEVKTISFRVDNTAPSLSISTAETDASNQAETVSFGMEESFWSDASGTVKIYRRANDGENESLYKTIELTPSASLTTVSEKLEETGSYRFDFTAKDRTGNESTASGSFVIDTTAPVIEVAAGDGVESIDEIQSYGKVNEPVAFTLQITDDFFTTNTITVKNSKRTDIKDKENDFELTVEGANTSLAEIPVKLDVDGIYDIEISSKDIAGNETIYTLNHFTLDQEAPDVTRVQEALADYDGKKVQSLDLIDDIDSLIDDLTVCDSEVLLNGTAYDGNSELADGSYTLDITVTDELGFVSEVKGISFEIDTKKPTFIVVGVEDGDIKNETYDIEVSLQLDEDTLTYVALDGEQQNVANNTVSLTVDGKGKHELTMKAVDEAGNEAEQTITFTYGKNKSVLPWIILAVCAAVAVGCIIFAGKKKKSDKSA